MDYVPCVNDVNFEVTAWTMIVDCVAIAKIVALHRNIILRRCKILKNSTKILFRMMCSRK